uniref:Ubiquitin carboxyl-terminal hydrolase n=1 Tax=Strongyloides venezuelensis TaxID=75913 RepID=A0A0K0F3Z0_STRVS
MGSVGKLTKFCSHLQECSLPLPESLEEIKKKKCCVEECECEVLWLCLKTGCNSYFCGKKTNDHANAHYQSHNDHSIQMAVNTKKVWCEICSIIVLTQQQYHEMVKDNSQLQAYVISEKAISFMRLFELTDYDESDFINGRGKTGLNNLGNSCYMNAAIQALSNCPPLTRYFLNRFPYYEDEFDDPDRLLLNDLTPVAGTYNDLLNILWSEDRRYSTSPHHLLGLVSRRFPQFAGYGQQDSQEFIRCFLDILHNELRRPVYKWERDYDEKMMLIHKEKDVGTPSTDLSTTNTDATDSGLSSESEECSEGNNSSIGSFTKDKIIKKLPITEEMKNNFDYNLKNVKYSKSIISEIFDGKLRSTVKCTTCNYLSHTTETFQDLSLSIPTPEHLKKVKQILEDGEGCESVVTSTPKNNNNLYNYLLSYILWSGRAFIYPFYTNTIGAMYNYFFSGTVDLEDCLESFFCPEHLNGDDMYSCEKCSKLRVGVKTCKLKCLPEILCIHLKRFRHDQHGYNFKVNTKVTFPICKLDVKKYIDKKMLPKNASTQYDLVSMISHQGGSLDWGHYVAYCRNDMDGCWYEYNDSNVIKRDQLYILNVEAYVLFYQKRDVNRNMETIRSRTIQIINTLREKFSRKKNNFLMTDVKYISREWIYKFNLFSNPGNINNYNFLCPHGLILPPMINSISNVAVPIPSRLYQYLSSQFGGGPSTGILSECKICTEIHQSFIKQCIELSDISGQKKSSISSQL